MSEACDSKPDAWASAKRILDTLLASAQSRVELIAVELQEEKCRLLEALACAVAVAGPERLCRHHRRTQEGSRVFGHEQLTRCREHKAALLQQSAIHRSALVKQAQNLRRVAG
jgi:hypothetical protein